MKTSTISHFHDIDGTLILKQNRINFPRNEYLLKFAKQNRKRGILSEVIFWQAVSKGKFYNINFDRQKPIGNYVVDFYVKTLSLIIEIDGASHDEKFEYNRIRTQYFEELGLSVFRIGDLDVKQNLDLVMSDLKDYIVKEYGV